jgi:hypothetical protein
MQTANQRSNAMQTTAANYREAAEWNEFFNKVEVNKGNIPAGDKHLLLAAMYRDSVKQREAA